MKYVMLLNAGIPCPVVFPDLVSHDLVVPRNEPSFRLRSAGFFSVSGGVVSTFGRSTSLKSAFPKACDPHPDDAEILTIALSGNEAMLPLLAVHADEEVGA